MHMVLLVISKPAKLTSSRENGILRIEDEALSSAYVRPFSSLSSIMSDHRWVSLIHLVLVGKEITISSYLLEYPSPDLMYHGKVHSTSRSMASVYLHKLTHTCLS